MVIEVLRVLGVDTLYVATSHSPSNQGGFFFQKLLCGSSSGNLEQFLKCLIAVV